MSDRRSSSPVIAVIGAGPAGVFAAFAASTAEGAPENLRVLLFERGETAARKILSTGNGRCNIANETMGEEYYRSSSGFAYEDLFRGFDAGRLLAPLIERGVFFHSRQGYIYPADDRAATVREALEDLALTGGITFLTGTGISRVQMPEKAGDGFLLTADDGRVFRADRLIVACGGLAYPASGSTGDGLAFAAAAGHRLVEPVPALVPLKVKERYVDCARGVRTEAEAVLAADGVELGRSAGEVQFTSGTVSGIPVFQLSGRALRALSEGRQVALSISFVSVLDSCTGEEHVPACRFNPGWDAFSRERILHPGQRTAGELFAGAVHPGVGRMAAESLGIPAEKRAAKLSEKERAALKERLSSLPFTVCGSAGFERAQTTSGGVAFTETGKGGASRIVPGLYFAGEVMDADGLCGGYNLTFALQSGRAAGEAAAHSIKEGYSC